MSVFNHTIFSESTWNREADGSEQDLIIPNATSLKVADRKKEKHIEIVMTRRRAAAPR